MHMVVTRAAPASAILLFLSAGQCRISVCRARLLLVEEWLVSLLVIGVGLPMPLFSSVLSHPHQEEAKGIERSNRGSRKGRCPSQRSQPPGPSAGYHFPEKHEFCALSVV